MIDKLYLIFIVGIVVKSRTSAENSISSRFNMSDGTQSMYNNLKLKLAVNQKALP